MSPAASRHPSGSTGHQLRLVLRAGLAACSLGLLPGAPAPIIVARSESRVPAALSQLSEHNPYRAALIRLAEAPDADQEAIKAWVNPPDDAPAPTLTGVQQALARELTAAVVAAANHPPLTAENWSPLPDLEDIDSITAYTIPSVGHLRDLARIATKTADSLPPDEAITVYAAAARSGRQQRANNVIIHQLTGAAIEGYALSAATRRLGEFDADQLRRLASAWAELGPAPDPAFSIVGERDLFFIPLVRCVIKKILAEDAADTDGTADEPTFTRHLRLSGLIDLGDGEHRINLENAATGQHFSISPGHPAEGIALVRIDFPAHTAIIRRDEREAVIHLESKKIVERRPLGPRAKKLLADLFNTDAAAAEQWFERLSAHPGGTEGYLTDLVAAYDQRLAAHLAAANQAKPGDAPPTPDDLFIAGLMPDLGRAVRILNRSATEGAMIQAAIDHQLGRLNQSTAPGANRDPWSEDDAPFALTPTPDGGFTLRSRYETAPGAPLTYKFAAPDAGMVKFK